MNRDTILNRFRVEACSKNGYSWATYQPIPLPGYEETSKLAGRACADRANAIFGDIARSFSRPVSLIDWGCNLGFFAFEAAKEGHMAVGVEQQKDFVETARFLSQNACPYYRVPFLRASLSPETVVQYGPFDVALCLSVLHHMKWSEQTATLREMADAYSVCYVEMDGRDYGRSTLEVCFYFVDEVCEVADRYGQGRRKRKTFRCSNERDGVRYCNLKTMNFVAGRGVFLKENGVKRTVIKREARSCSHTWLHTSLEHELRMYRELRLPQFVELVDSGEDERFRWLELEYAERSAAPSIEEIRDFFSELERRKLFMFDVVRDSFIQTTSGLRVVDIESLFPLVGSVEDTARSVFRVPDKKIPYPTYQSAVDALSRMFGTRS